MRPPWGGFPASDCYGTLSVNAVAMQRAPWHVKLTNLFRTPDQRGANRILPGVTGVRKYRKRSTETRYSLPFLITGQYDLANQRVVGDEDEWAAQLVENMAYLNANVLLPTNTGDGTVLAVWTPPGHAAVNAYVHVLTLPEPEGLPRVFLRTTLELEVPGGDLHL